MGNQEGRAEWDNTSCQCGHRQVDHYCGGGFCAHCVCREFRGRHETEEPGATEEAQLYKETIMAGLGVTEEQMKHASISKAMEHAGLVPKIEPIEEPGAADLPTLAAVVASLRSEVERLQKERDEAVGDLEKVWGGVRYTGGKDLERRVIWAIPIAQKLKSKEEKNA